MKKRASAALFAVVAAFGCLSTGCRCTAERNAVAEIEKTQAIMDVEYLKYVEADSKLDAASKDDRKKLVESRQRLLNRLKKSLE